MDWRCIGVLILGARLSAAVALAAPTTEDEFRTCLPVALGSTPLADRVGVTNGIQWYAWSLRSMSETTIATVAASPNDHRLSGVIAFLNGGAAALDRALVQVRILLPSRLGPAI